jgi:glutamyl-tRNA reductase
MELVVCGVNHRTSPVELRERLALSPDAVRAWLAGARDADSVREVAVLSTCNRTELYAVTNHGEGAAALAHARLSDLAGANGRNGASDPGTGIPIAPEHVYAHRGADAARHAMRVAAGLDSLVLGERQILGQVKDAYALARTAGTVGAVLDRMFGAALHAAKRVHTDTEVGSGAVSVASAAIVLAEKVLGTLAGRKVLVIGAGDTGTLAARHLAKHQPAALLLANRTLARAEALAAEVGGRALALDAIPAALAEVDVTVCTTRATDYVITAGMVSKALRGRSGRALVLVDIAMPRNVDPAAAAADNVFVYAIDALSAVVDHSLARRRRETIRADAILEEEAEKFGTWLRSQAAMPLVRELHEHFERVRADEVKRSLKHFSPEEQPHVEQLTKALISKLLQAPTIRLKGIDPAQESGLCWAETVRGLFALGSSRNEGGSSGA